MINAQGLRGTLPTGDESERIMVLGDSSFFGFGVADDETLSAGLRGGSRTPPPSTVPFPATPRSSPSA